MTSLISPGLIVSRQGHCPQRQRGTESDRGAGAIHADEDVWFGSWLGGRESREMLEWARSWAWSSR